MDMTKREFFKLKHRKHIYNIYSNVASRAYDLSETFLTKLKLIRELKDHYRDNDSIWQLLHNTEAVCTSNFEFEAIVRCNSAGKNDFKTSHAAYGALTYDIRKLSLAIGRMSAVIDLFEYMKKNDLCLRAKK